ncbi:5291_t:CDS:2 [Ambispora gerdemannii]|uniref:D-arabinono-1,4-lactone oxidase n=1 Tax=Ambispora gerdemannii TaxID=144530 RepID=A0A9N8YI72_9GLOM|nr:5291_t:CDS:2 [Ambispora gerdemannii]
MSGQVAKAPNLGNKQKNYQFRNWSSTFKCVPELYFRPKSEDELVNIVNLARENHKTIKVVGSGHSPSDLACTNEYMINLDDLNHVLEFDPKSRIITVEAGIRLFQLNQELKWRGIALSNLGAISDQSIAGAISSATHGTGINFGNLSTQVIGLTMITASGKKIHCSEVKDAEIFKAALCSVGALGIITRVTIQCEPEFRLEAEQQPMKLDTILNDLKEIVCSAEHVRFWWSPHTDDCAKQAETIGYFRETILGYHLYQFLLYLTRFYPPTIPRLAHLMFLIKFNKGTLMVDDSYKVFNSDCLFEQYVNEWAIPWERTAEALRKLGQWVRENDEKGIYVHFPVEVRFVDKDDIWLSPSYGRKAHTMFKDELTKAYPKFKDFLELREELDPEGIFLNPYLRRHLLGEYGPKVDAAQFKARL